MKLLSRLFKKSKTDEELQNEEITRKIEEYRLGINAGTQLALHVMSLDRANKLEPEFIAMIVEETKSLLSHSNSRNSYACGFGKVMKEQILPKYAEEEILSKIYFVEFTPSESMTEQEIKEYNVIPFTGNPAPSIKTYEDENYITCDQYLRHS